MSDDISIITAKMSEIMLKSEYDKVIFHDIADSYPTDADIQFEYSLTDAVIPADGDLLALFKVGWEAPNLYLQAEKAAISEENDGSTKRCVMFKAENLPKDDGIFYQFCYICSDGIVKGASTPFRFHAPTTDELVEVEDTDSDLLVIRTRTAVIEERLWDMVVKNRELLKCKAQLERELKDGKTKLNETEEKLSAHKENLKTLKEEQHNEIAKMQKEMDRLQDAFEMEQARTTYDMSDFKNQMIQNEAYIEELRATVKLLTEENENTAANLTLAKKQIETLQKRAEESDLHLQSVSGKNEKLIQMIADDQEDTHKLQQKVHNLESQLSEEQKLNVELKKKEALIDHEKTELASRLIDTEHMLAAMEKSKHMATEELLANAESKIKITKELEDRKSQLVALHEQYKILRLEKETMRTETDKLLAQHQELIAKHQEIRSEFESYAYIREQSIEETKTLLTIVNDLKLRLQAGANEYQAKYIECMRLEKKVEKLKGTKGRSPKSSESQKSEVNNLVTQDSASQCESSGDSNVKVDAKSDATSINYENMLIAKDITIQTLQQQLQVVTNLLGNLHAGCNVPFGTYASPPPQPYTSYLPWVPTDVRQGNGVFYYPPSVGSNDEQNDQSEPTTPVVTTTLSPANGIDPDHLPPPMQPEITALAKLAAITAVTKHFTEASTEMSAQSSTTTPTPDVVTFNRDIEPDGPLQADSSKLTIPVQNKCPVCSNTFNDLPTLQEHIEIHFGQECPVCSRPFGPDDETALEQHINSHFEQDASIQRYNLNFD